MDIYANSKGLKISKSSDCFVFDNKENNEKTEISFRKIDKIIVSMSVSITSDAIKLALTNNIDIIFMDRDKSIGRVWNNKFGSIPTIRRNQLLLEENDLGMQLIKEFISTKMNNQIKLLKKLSKSKGTKLKENVNNSIEIINENKEKLLSLEGRINENRNIILGYEGSSSKEYFKSINLLLPKEYKFDKRSQHPANDIFNSLLNYSYAILYSYVESGIINAGLDPYIGILHCDNYNKKSFLFDIVEMYRIYIDEVVFNICKEKLVEKCMFKIIDDSYVLGDNCKKILIPRIGEKLSSTTKVNNKNIGIKNEINLKCQTIASNILKEEKIIC